ncbi:hypothetical protein PHMEG_0006355 [Phytophthora megakarya]|uniref:Helitron helicase n=1 Tax=Phytophthora megakarya TaxID=4795 RepID=A0A225WPZ1_9STRA|nr:hypothetical protein PHMEG_0006355 [Phytophthora megakarya]
MDNEELSIAREQSRARMAIHRLQADGTRMRAISTIEEHTRNIQRHSIGEMTFECPHCHALKWKGENKYPCCLDGRVLIAPPNDPPAFVKKFVETPALLRQI